MWTASNTRSLLLLVYIHLWLLSDSVCTTTGSIIYVSRSGYDTSACGTKVRPCKTIATAINQVKDWGELIYIDGTGTDRDPYTCKNLTSQHPGIYVNRSISLIGQQLPVYIECGKGLSLIFEAGKKSKTPMTIKLQNIMFVRSSLTFNDCSVQINGCSFIGGPQPISMAQVTQSVNLSIANSECMNSSACFSVEQKAQNPSGNHVTIEIHNTQVMGMRARYVPTTPTTGAALYVTSETSPYAPELITTDIHLSSVTFTDNQFSGSGLLYFKIPVAQATMTLDNVTLSKTSALRTTPNSNTIVIYGLHRLNLRIENSLFSDNVYGIRCLSADTSGDVSVRIINSQFVDHQSSGHGAVLLISTPTASRLEVTSSKFTRNRADGMGGCFHMTAQTLTAIIQDSIFAGSHAAYSGVSYFSATALVKVAVNNSLFLGNSAEGPGGVMGCYGDVVNVTILNTKVFNSGALGPGGVFASSYGGQALRSLYMLFDRVHIENSTSKAPGGVIVFTTDHNAIVTIRNSLIINSSATNAPGGAISAYVIGRPGLVMELSNTSFRRSITQAPGGTIYALGVTSFKCKNVHVSSSMA